MIQPMRRYGFFLLLLFILQAGYGQESFPGNPAGAYLAACAKWKNTSSDSLCRYAQLARQAASAGGSEGDRALAEGDRALADCYCAQCLLLHAKMDSARQVLGQAFALLKDSMRRPDVYEQLGQLQVAN
jgi:hypothetical protein